jgi:hypothetical protein
MAVALLSDRPGSMLICNGYKDAAYMELVRQSTQSLHDQAERNRTCLHDYAAMTRSLAICCNLTIT